jgi:hypothetical protein
MRRPLLSGARQLRCYPWRSGQYSPMVAVVDTMVAKVVTQHREGLVERCGRIIDIPKIKCLLDGRTSGGITKSPHVVTK